MSKESLLRLYRSKQTENTAEWLSNTIVCVIVTTVCDKWCSLCCYKDIVHDVNARHFPVDEILAEITQLREVGNVCISGGEPTLHPEIAYILREGRKIRGTAHFSLITNGANLLPVAEATGYLDTLRFSLYRETPEEARIVTEYKKVKPSNVDLSLEVVNHREIKGRLIPCDLLQTTLSVMHGRVYPCCVGAGVAEAPYTDLSDGWERRLLSVEAPCERCFNAL